MPLKIRKRQVRKRVMRRKKPMRKKQVSTLAKTVHNFSRWADVSYRSTVILNASAIGFAKAFSLSDLSSYTEFTNLYDQYRICMVVAYIHLQSNPDAQAQLNNSAVLTSANFFPKVWYCADRDDANTPTLQEMKEHRGVKCRVLRPNSFVKVTLKPTVLNQTYGTALTTGYEPKYNQFVDMANTSIQHYGLKCLFDCEGVAPNTEFRVVIDYKYYIQCKDPR